MVAPFKDRSPLAIVWLLLLSLSVHSHFLFNFSGVQAPRLDGLFSQLLVRYITQIAPAFQIVLYHLIIITQALYLNFLFSENKMYSRPNFLPAMVYILLTGIFTEWSALTPALFDNWLVIWLYAQTLKLYNAPQPKTLLFNIGLIIGVSIICYYPSALLILVALFAVLVVRPFVATELLVLMMGVLSPFYFFGSYLYLRDRFPLLGNYLPHWQLNLPDTSITAWFFVTAGLIILLLAAGLVVWQNDNRRLLIHLRKNWGVLIVMLLVMLPIPFINRNAGLDSLMLWIIPASPFIAKAFLAPKQNILPNLMFWSLLALSIVKNWGIVK